MLHIIWNRNAGTADRHEPFRDELASRDDISLLMPASADDARDMAAEAARGGADVVIAAGGDGTVNDVARALIDSGMNTVLAVIPLGTGNDFCRNAGIPLDPARAMQLIETEEPCSIDVVHARIGPEESYFLNMASGGNSGLYADLITDEMKSFWEPLVYLRGAVDMLSQMETFRVQMHFDDQAPVLLDALNVFVANGRVTGGGLLVAPDARFNDGLLDVVVVLDGTPIDVAALAADYLLNATRYSDMLVRRRCRAVAIDASPELPFAVDGNLLSSGPVPSGPVQFTVIPDRLRVIIGPTECPARLCAEDSAVTA